MQKTQSRTWEKIKNFFKQNLALVIIIACVLAIATIVIITSTTGGEVPVSQDPYVDDTPKEPELPEKPKKDKLSIEEKQFEMPLEYTSISMNYTNDSDNMFVFNRTLDMWTAHRAIDFSAVENTAVKSMRAGTVAEVGYNYSYGNYVIVDHGDGIKATYASLDTPTVVAGQQLAKGDIMGVISTSASFEYKDGAHLHLSMTLNGETVNPWDYLLKD